MTNFILQKNLTVGFWQIIFSYKGYYVYENHILVLFGVDMLYTVEHENTPQRKLVRITEK